MQRINLRLAGLGILIALALASGCASVERDEFLALQSQVYRNQRTLKELEQKIEKGRRPQAELGADMNALRQEMARLRGQVEETHHRLNQVPGSQAISDLERKASQTQDETQKRLARLEGLLGVSGDKVTATPKPRTKPQPKPVAKPAPPAPAPPPQSDEAIYKLGHRLYKQKNFNAARDRFQDMLKKFPKSNLAPSAHFWIGETYYSQKKFEEAILAYNQVVKRYRKSSKAPAALLKQGLSFSSLGDKLTARVVLKKLIKDYPKSSQAKTARNLLKKIK
ncbi:MAG: tol-pal system protein YbgF [Desulfarculaceae bacterium]|jgi:tol-pal system protein YbgF